jgi:hypothetical protein
VPRRRPSAGHSKPTDSSRAIIAEAHKAAAAGRGPQRADLGRRDGHARRHSTTIPSIAPHVRFFNINTQDPHAYAYIEDNFKGELDMWVDDQSTFRGMYQTPTSTGVIPGWHQENAEGHGALGDLFADLSGDIFNESGVKMGDSPTVLRFLSGDQDDPSKESWGGEFVEVSPGYWTDATSDGLDLDRSGTDGAYTIYEDRDAWMDDFAERLDWLQEAAPAPAHRPCPARASARSRPSPRHPPRAATSGERLVRGRRGAYRASTRPPPRCRAGPQYRGPDRALERPPRRGRERWYRLRRARPCGRPRWLLPGRADHGGPSLQPQLRLALPAGAGSSTQGVEVVWNGEVVATTSPAAGWGTFTTTVTGTGGRDRLTIREVGSQGGDGWGALVDDVALVPKAPASGGQGPDVVSVTASGDHWEGDPAFELLVNGEVVDAWTAVPDDRAEGEWDTIVFRGDFDLDGSDQVTIRFVNDHYEGRGRDRNLYVSEVSLNGQSNGTDQSLYAADTATWDF